MKHFMMKRTSTLRQSLLKKKSVQILCYAQRRTVFAAPVRGEGSSINHVDWFLDIFDHLPPVVDKHGFLADPPKNHVDFSNTPPPQA